MSDKIKEAIDVVKNCTPVKVENQNETVDMFRDALIVLSDLAEQYIACGEKMPAKKRCGKTYKCEFCPYSEGCDIDTQNKLIDVCTIITTKLLSQKDSELYNIKSWYEVKLDKVNKEIEQLKNAQAQTR